MQQAVLTRTLQVNFNKYLNHDGYPGTDLLGLQEDPDFVAFLHSLGWSDHFASPLAASSCPGRLPGRVITQHHHLYSLATPVGEVLAQISGKLMSQALGPEDYPVVGDWVSLQVFPNQDRGVIQQLLPRKTLLFRYGGQSRKNRSNRIEKQPLAANIDTVFLVVGLDQDFNPSRIERYLVMIRESGASGVILLNKVDLHPDLLSIRQEVESMALGIPILEISALHQQGLEAMGGYLQPGQTAVLLGSSGVGKSTLTNRLLGHDQQTVGHLRHGDDQGRHTTSSRSLFSLANGSLLIDTPGLRELQAGSHEQSLKEPFADIEDLAQACRFRNCQHEQEPGCAVRSALESGALDSRRFQNYRKLQKEIRHHDQQHNPLIQREVKAKWKKIHKSMRHHPKRGRE